ncbi:hypothetical protein K493DRAFT_297688 [Basidiobolus meristosporus CBS 931.73]|uniref:Exosome complex component RRP4 n=1 Tax=Basidiobolus meristosporus CBS 931.73 TaxID=1314790 RepID=A0A1Y1YXZ2_9FUNG|nr:hypothetical protein K493DRAFT_297688 [Basidiobolus meristosporus CBS 931.73]|eukprot:ORY02892.1 hypothetical protein K493DRAFT_297688 [Basidiobolus meristosporus CBS 931.73]
MVEDTENHIGHIVTPGECITSDTAFMRGHGTYLDEERVLSSLAGVVERVNKLISVKPLRSRYTGEIGDVVVGRIIDVSNRGIVGQKRWKVDTNSRQDSVLLLSSINLPGGVQRRKSESDELQMRMFFAEGDLVVAEAQAFFGDGAMSLHTRSLKYGKLRNGSFVVVSPSLVQRSRSHFHTLPFGVDVILGLNGYIWVSKSVPQSEVELNPEAVYSNENQEISVVERETIARVCNCIQALNKQFMSIHDTAIIYAYEASLNYPIQDLLKDEVMAQIKIEVLANLRNE